MLLCGVWSCIMDFHVSFRLEPRFRNFIQINLAVNILWIHGSALLHHLLSPLNLSDFIQQYHIIIQHSRIFRIDIHTQLIQLLCLILPPHIIQHQPIIRITNSRNRITINTNFIIFFRLLSLTKLIKTISN